ncbi:hypothetical protein CJ305_13195 [Leeuwenhoekiella nanhaiensis]|uniref:HPt domain-containing protein n=1 Tax=Leeuwenhoekiella nanhaiensis TaxID=1655491 RepID=A0A2G1VPR3_9FLAO|nr:hypothetical protein CJ305_13195 [Leeuwenhoekiella nanhaiensis]
MSPNFKINELSRKPKTNPTNLNSTLKHILFIDADRDAQSLFNEHFDRDNFLVINFNSAMGAIQHIKESKPVDVLVIDEFAKPMGAAQTLNYLIDELHFKGKVFVCSVDKEQFETDLGVYGVLKKPFDRDEFEKVEALLTEKNTAVESLYSLDYLKELSDGDLVFIEQSIQIFMDTVAPRIEEMKKVLASKDYQAVAELAHNIKPSFEMILNTRGAELCNFLAHHAKPADFKSYVEDLEEEYVQVEKQLKNDFSQEQNLS